MTVESTSLVKANFVTGEWRAFGDFLRRPILPDRAAPGNANALFGTLRMLGLDAIVMGILLSIAFVVISVGFELPETALAGMEITAGLVLAVVVGAPLGEELLFRSWLSGRPGHVLGLIVFALVGGIAAVALSAAGVNIGGDTDPIAAGGVNMVLGVIIGGLAALLIVFLFRKRDAIGWFQRIFPVFFWLSAIAFASVHLANFEEGGPILLALILPQFILGTILGYVRVNYGLWYSILLHAMHNGIIIGVVALFGGWAG